MDTSNINTEYYKVFYYVGRLGSITAAAEALCISQPAVSQAVKQLEKALNSQLFIRTQKGVRLTAEGELLFPYVERGIENLLDGERMLRRLVDLDMGEVRIGASDMTLQFYLLPHLERFHGRYPNIKVMVSNAPTPETIQSLYEGRIDFGVVSTPFDARPEVAARPVKKIRNIFVAGNQYQSLKGKRLEYGALMDLPCIFLEKNTSTRRFMDQFLEERGVFLEPEFELEKGFPEFLGNVKEGDVKAEYLLPAMIDQCIRTGKARVRVLETRDKWFGVTYKEDKPAVVASIRRLVDEGVYPEKLF